jgi:hypothetical protein
MITRSLIYLVWILGLLLVVLSFEAQAVSSNILFYKAVQKTILIGNSGSNITARFSYQPHLISQRTTPEERRNNSYNTQTT